MHDWRIGGGLLALVTLAYPLIVYFSLDRFEPRWLALLLFGLALLRLAASRTALAWGCAGGAFLFALFSWFGNAWMPLKLYPVGVNAILLVIFAASLVYPPSAIERLARLREPDLPPAAVAYTRRVTQLWCVFFVLNGAVACVTALWASNAVWTLYNGFISYCLIGVLMAAEWLVRRRVRARNGLA
ncbi:hypothetical protein D5039_07400 [Verminephrobacter aporrectodeae subsp. tuberculatae]|uniref:DNA gyrase subunit B n=1 Tax=Verminephrobacter aporrectodeae subsp. tuberculatae TaxID=1110392 RepID=A0ABT3KRN9_9BURK|nr:hypothetical protein [Verminephrobacter aporrectodeae]MCW5320993.1 hypothetical protein [Verminephrobacter aporrectodeae subsp. tuberculatae]